MRGRLTILLALAPVLAAQSHIIGVTVDGAGEPIAGAHIRAGSIEARSRTVAHTRSDRQGRYRLEVPVGRYTLAATARGYYAKKAGDLDSSSITVNCADAGECGEIDFTLAKHSVLEGTLTGAHGAPEPAVLVILHPADAEPVRRPGPPMMGGAGRSLTDDRGYFRIWDLKPGRYRLELTPRRLGGGRPEPQPFQGPEVIEITEDRAVTQVQLSLGGGKPLRAFRVSGVVEDPPDGVRSWMLTVSPLEDPLGVARPLAFHRLTEEGEFAVSSLPEGEYVFRLVGMGDGPVSRRQVSLGAVSVHDDITDLQLTPRPPTGVRFTVDFRDSTPSALTLFLTPQSGGSFEHVPLSGPEYEAEHGALAPGAYDIRLSAMGHYLLQPREIVVSEGQVSQVTLLVGDDFATLRGRVRVEEGEERSGAAHFTVGLRDRDAPRKVQTDAEGFFVFDRLAPGDYRLAAWADPDVDVGDERVWREAGAAVREIALEEGFEVEIDLTTARRGARP